MTKNLINVEQKRLNEAEKGTPWRMWGPYLSERQWGTVREDGSENGDAWNYFTHDQVRSRGFATKDRFDAARPRELQRVTKTQRQ